PQGSYHVTLTVTGQDGGTASVTQTIEMKDYLIFSLGDSSASGEGNPDIPQQYDAFGRLTAAPRWEDQRAHRSAFAGPAQAALAIEDTDPHSSVTFVSLAASGAQIEGGLDGHGFASGGLLTPYDGTESPTAPGHAPLPPQVEEMFRIANGRPIDALIVNIGI